MSYSFYVKNLSCITMLFAVAISYETVKDHAPGKNDIRFHVLRFYPDAWSYFIPI